MPLPLVAIIGRPNVGKSTLFNRLVGRRRAIVTDEPGVTRDRIYGEVPDVPRAFRVVDTGGLTPDGDAPYAEEIARQAERAMVEAVCLLFVVDAVAGPTAVDLEVARLLRRRGLPLLLVANKVDSPGREASVLDWHELGLGEPIPVSAEHGLGVTELLERIDELLVAHGPSPDEGRSEELVLRLAIVGRPNVGKSSLLNRIAGEERAVVSDVPGTTRDAVDTVVEILGRAYRIVDTAGIRRSPRLRHKAERFSVARAERNIAECDVAVLVLDATRPIATQDAHIAGLVQQAFRPLLVAVNKWDLVEEREEAVRAWEDSVRARLPFASEAPIVFTSARSGQRVLRLLELALELYRRGANRVPTPELNRWLERSAAAQREARGHGVLRVYYATQTGTHPPGFVLFCNDPRKASPAFRRYLENSLRGEFGYAGVPIRLQFRGRRARPRTA